MAARRDPVACDRIPDDLDYLIPDRPNETSPRRPMTTRETPRRKRLFRVFAVMIGLSPFLVAELVLRMAGLGRPTDFNDPFVGFSDIHPLFVLNTETNQYEIPESRRTHFRPASFPAHKDEHEFRIFVLGGSTVQGRPYRVETSFTTWLELSLNAADPSCQWDVINCGGISYASYRLVPILQEILHYEPDLIIICTGHNEFLEDRSYGHLKDSPEVLAWPQRNVSRLRTYNLIRDGVLRATGSLPNDDAGNRPELGSEVDPLLDWKGGIEAYHRDPEWHRGVIAHFGFNLRRMVHLAEVTKVPMMLMNPVSNLEWPPFKSEHRGDITDAEREEFRLLSDQPGERSARRLVEIDSEHARAWHRLGMYYRNSGRLHEAHDAFIRAKELDVCPLRMPEAIREWIDIVAHESDLTLVDMEERIAAVSHSGFPDNQWLVDHVHPTVAGHQLIAEALMERLTKQGYLKPRDGWIVIRDQAYQSHLESLDDAYFAWGDRALRNVQSWAHGLVEEDKPSGESQP